MVDKKNKGGQSMVMRCASKIRHGADCPFYCKLRRSSRDNLWYICRGLVSSHSCHPGSIPPRFQDISSLLALRNEDDIPAEEEKKT